MLGIFIKLPLVLLRSLFETLFAVVKRLVPLWLWRKKSVEGDIVLITGAGSGIGRQIALNFAQERAVLVLWDVDKFGNEETAKLVGQLNAEVYTYTCDVTKRENVYKLARKVQQEVGPVSILVNNAGIVSGKYFLDLKDESIIKTMEVNTLAHFWTIKAFLPDMVRRNHGHIVTISSVVGDGGVAGLSDYSASKCAVKGMHDALLREMHVSKSDVKCTVICPYGVSTGMFDGAQTRFEFLTPFITPEYAGKKIVQGILTERDVLYVPQDWQILVYLKHILPVNAQLVLEDFINANEAMMSFVGRRPAKKQRKNHHME
ncbi:Epidermal retinol dehydrogenase 2 [Holothuria leucospilota]|uniref:Short-chain dehydrogenase/reductase 3 n=1 Tax=Holothuria leucospilota TaxID=206669 RepID=A0A9Q1CD21_HOLLE|nr:Epidermal retinol dehydrogenase 2 [Holothuria leucospilota]